MNRMPTRTEIHRAAHILWKHDGSGNRVAYWLWRIATAPNPFQYLIRIFHP